MLVLMCLWCRSWPRESVLHWFASRIARHFASHCLQVRLSALRAGGLMQMSGTHKACRIIPQVSVCSGFLVCALVLVWRTLKEIVFNSGSTRERTAIHDGSIRVRIGWGEDRCHWQTHIPCSRQRYGGWTAWRANPARACGCVVGDPILWKAKVHIGGSGRANPWACCSPR